MSLPELFTTVARASCLGSASVLLLLVLRRFAGKALSPVWRCWLWLPVATLFVLPRLPDLGLGLKETKPAAVVHEWLDVKPTAANTTSPIEIPSALAPNAAAVIMEPTVIPWREWAAWTWLGGFAVLLGLWLFSYGWLFKSVRRGRKPAPESLQALLVRCAHEAGLRKIPRLVVTDALENPAVAGLLRPVVLVPEKLPHLLATEELRLVLQHEVWHLKRRDLWWHWLSALLLAVHWFNPLLWIAIRLFRADREAACDAAVLSSCREDTRGIYGDTLLKLQARLSRVFSLRPAIGVLGGADLLKARIVDIANFGRGSRLAGRAALCFVVFVAAALALLAGEPAKDEALSISKKEPTETKPGLADTDAEKRQKVLHQIDQLAGVIPAQVYLNFKIVAFDPFKGLGNPQNWLARVSGDTENIVPKPTLELIATLTDAQIAILMRLVDSGWRDSNDHSTVVNPATDRTPLPFSDTFKKALSLGHPQIASAPSVTMLAGQKGQVEVIREFIYPTAFERQDVAEPAGNPKIVPTEFNMKPVGIMVQASPKVYPGGTIGLQLVPTLSAFLKWQELKSEDGEFIRNPIFGTTTCTTSFNLARGQTAVFGGYAYKAVFERRPFQEMQNHPPGDSLCPVLMLVSTKLLGPGGKPSKDGEAESKGIVIPNLQVSDVTLSDAVSQICDLAKKNDPRGLGINLMLSAPAASDSRVTLNASDVKLSTLLDLFAKLADLDLQVDGETVLLAQEAGGKSRPAQAGGKQHPVSFPVAHAAIGQKSFLKGDRIEILSVRATSPDFKVGDLVFVKGRYQLASHDAASLCLFTTQTQGDGHEEIDPSQKIKVEKGTHDFELGCVIRKKGYLHVSFYNLENEEGFGGVYFGSAKQMEEFNVGDWPVQTREKAGSVPLRAPDSPAPRFVPNSPSVTPTKP